MIRVLLWSLLWCTSVVATEIFDHKVSLHTSEVKEKGISLLGTIKLPNTLRNGLPLFGLSGLGWDEDMQELYALADNAQVYVFSLQFSALGRLQALVLKRHFRLKNRQGKRLKKRQTDSEGLTLRDANNGIKNDTELVVSFEREHRVWRFDSDGKFKKSVFMPLAFSDASKFLAANNGLESISTHPLLGLVVVKERQATTARWTELYSTGLNTILSFPLGIEKSSRVTGLDTMPNGNFMVLERSFRKVWLPLVIRLKELKITEKKASVVRTIARLDSSEGWLLDNFEGLAYINQGRYCMVSDNNDNPWQRTLLTCFKVKP